MAATITIKESVEPILEECRASLISSLKFNKLSPGNLAPEIKGGDLDIVLAAGGHVGSMVMRFKGVFGCLVYMGQKSEVPGEAFLQLTISSIK
ncbi:calcium-dependent lipid-binding transcriptional regulator [Artemisia annua]|uniref:Calcium-dependent lipid-binding transcriptional regulator n=1 Tax=Artemisia annua TaxID=35608 RepID=A0A2U1KN38_ARTAN|nr:calcium-dependent lipid-binding transcriptional regulator [Artemisia annua]